MRYLGSDSFTVNLVCHYDIYIMDEGTQLAWKWISQYPVSLIRSMAL